MLVQFYMASIKRSSQLLFPLFIFTSFLLLSACESLPSATETKIMAETVTTNKESKPLDLSYPNNELTDLVLYDLLIAGIAYDNGDYVLSYQMYNKLMEKTADPRLMKLIVRSALSSKNHKYMLESALLWEKYEANNKHIYQIKSMVYLKLKQDEKAISSLVKLVELAKDHEQGFKKVELFLSAIKDPTRLNNLFSSLYKHYPENFYLYISWSKFASQYPTPKIAKEKITKALALHPDSTMALLIQIEIHKKFKETNLLEKAYLEAISKTETPSLIRLEYAKFLLENKQNKLAIEQLGIITDTVKDNQEIIYEVGLLAFDIKEYSTAEMHLKKFYSFPQVKAKTKAEKLAQTEQKNKGAYALGKLYTQQEQNEEALIWLKKITSGLYYYQAILHRVLIQIDKKQFQTALNLIDSLSPTIEERKRSLLRLRADVLFQSEDYTKAYAAYSNALKVHNYENNKDDYNDLLYNRAMVSEKLNKIEDMEKDLQSILSKEPDNSNALNTLGFLLTEKTTRYKEAQAYIEKALKIAPTDMAIIDSMGWVLYKQGFIEKALTYLKKAYLIREDPEVAAHYGEVLWMLKKKKEAQKIWDKTLLKNPDDKILKSTIKRFNSK